jgi:hypothetical protein
LSRLLSCHQMSGPLLRIGPVGQLFPISGSAASIRPALIAARKPF